MIMGGEKWHYLTVKIMSRSLHSITSNYNDDIYCMNCLLSFRTRNKLKLHENVSKNQNHCNIQMLEARNEILKFNQNHQSIKILFIIYADT